MSDTPPTDFLTWLDILKWCAGSGLFVGGFKVIKYVMASRHRKESMERQARLDKSKTSTENKRMVFDLELKYRELSRADFSEMIKVLKDYAEEIKEDLDRERKARQDTENLIKHERDYAAARRKVVDSEINNLRCRLSEISRHIDVASSPVLEEKIHEIESHIEMIENQLPN